MEAKALGPNDTVLNYFQALKHGDVETIKDSITEEMYKRRRVLLEQNSNYPEYLKKVYQGAEFKIKETNVENNDALVNVEVNFQNKKTNFTLFLWKNAKGNWKIFKEITLP